MVTARDAALAGVGTRRGRGRPREFDVRQHLSMPRDLHRRVALFAEAQDITTASAYRALVTLALDELERTDA